MKVKCVLYVVLLVVLFLPFVEFFTGWTMAKKLSGVAESTEKPVFTWKDWFDGSFQSTGEAYLSDNAGCREIFIPIRNQIYWSVYDMNPNLNIIIGDDGHLYGWGNVAAVNGDDFIGQDSIDKRVYMIKKIQDTLLTLHKELLIVIAPGKGSYHRKFIPKRYFQNGEKPTNYTGSVEAFQKYDVSYLDFSKWFIAMKDTIAHPLFPKTGNHWSFFSWPVVTDSLVKYFSEGSGCRNYVTYKRLRLSKGAEDSDRDLELTFNLIFPLKQDAMAYPEEVKCMVDSNYKKKNIIIVGDSFTWGLMIADFAAIWENYQFWYYNRESYYAKKSLVADLDLRQEIDQTDFIMLMYTDGNLGVYGNGVIENIYKLYFAN